MNASSYKNGLHLISILTILIFMHTPMVHAQDMAVINAKIDSIDNANQSDSVRVDGLNYLAWVMQHNEWEEALEIAHVAVDRAQSMDYDYGLAVALETRGVIYDDHGFYAEAMDDLLAALEIWRRVGDPHLLISGNINLAVLFSKWSDTTKQLYYYDEALRLESEYGDKTSIPFILNNKASIYSERGQYNKALRLYQAALDSMSNMPPQYQEEEHSFLVMMQSNIANLYRRKGDLDVAHKMYDDLISEAIDLNNSASIASIYIGLAAVEHEKGLISKAYEHCREGIKYAEIAGLLDQKSTIYRLMAKIQQDRRDFESANYFFLKYDTVMQEMNEITVQSSVREMEARFQIDQKELEIENQNLKLEEQDARLGRQKIALISIIGFSILALLLGGLFYNRYKLKKRATSALEQKNALLDEERKRSDALLYNILPVNTAKELKERGKTTARHYDNVSVLFTDFQGFSRLAKSIAPQVLVNTLDEYFRGFDQIMDQYNLEKIKTIGDAYMACTGFGHNEGDHALRTVKAALEIQELIESINKKRRETGLPFFEARIGIHSGPVVAGVVGVKKFAYDIWGDTVNIAARMETAGEVGRVNISQSTFDQISDHFEYQSRGPIDMKNRGKMNMYFIDQTKT